MKFIVRMFYVTAAMVLLVNLVRYFIHLQQTESHGKAIDGRKYAMSWKVVMYMCKLRCISYSFVILQDFSVHPEVLVT